MQVFKTLIDITKDIEGAKVENHKFCASVHYRNVEENVRINYYPNHDDLIIDLLVILNLI